MVTQGKLLYMLHAEIIYIMAHIRKLGGPFTNLELLTFTLAKSGSVITSFLYVLNL